MSKHADATQSRLGQLLINKNLISQNQLTQALNYQVKHQVKLGTALNQLNLVSSRVIRKQLLKQRLIRLLASSLVLTWVPTELLAKDDLLVTAPNPEATSFYQSNEQKILSLASSETQIDFVAKPVENWSMEFYFSGDKHHLLSLNSDISDLASIQFSLFNASLPAFSNHYEYQFEPQIALYTSYSKSATLSYSSNRAIGPGLDRGSNTKPVIYMLTLKGRCLYENSGKQTVMWSLDRAKKGVQRKAELMFSITKHF
jgi:hypothetical protein